MRAFMKAVSVLALTFTMACASGTPDADEFGEVPSAEDLYAEGVAKLEEGGFRPGQAAISLEPTSTVSLHGREAETMLRLADALEDLDDVQSVNANFDISEEEMTRIAG